MQTSTTASALWDGALPLLAFFGGVVLTWWALGALKWERFVHQVMSPQTSMLRFLVSLLGGLLLGTIAGEYIAYLHVMQIM